MPGSSPRFLEKSRSLSVDCVAYDLEDSVTPAKKEDARHLVRRQLETTLPPGIKERAVRINSVGSGLALSDLNEVLKAPNLTTIVVPKVESASDLTFVTDVIDRHRSNASVASTISSLLPYTDHVPRPTTPPISIIALIESARSILNLSSITTATPLLSGLIFAAEDFALDLSLTRTPSLTEFLYARSAIATAARAANLPSTIDLVCTAFKTESDHATLESECRDGKRMGFNGKQCIHPSQLSTVEKVFSPEPEEVEWAVRIEIAQKKAEERGKGAWALDGKMIDRPVEGKAKAVVEKARACGIDVEELRERYRDQEPE